MANSKCLSLLGVVATLLLAHCVQGAEPPKPAEPKSPLELSFSVSPLRARANVPIVAKAQVKNISDRAIDHEACMYLFKLHRFNVTRNGAIVPRTALGAKMRGGGSVMTHSFAAGRTETDEIVVNQVFDMSAPGKYRVKYTYSTDWAESGEQRSSSVLLSQEVTVTIDPSPSPLVVYPIEFLNKENKPKELQGGWHLGIKMDKRKFRLFEPIVVHVTEEYWGQKSVECFNEREFLDYGPSVIVANLDGSAMRRTTLFNELYEKSWKSGPIKVGANRSSDEKAIDDAMKIAPMLDAGLLGKDYFANPTEVLISELFSRREPFTQVRATFTINQIWDMNARTSYLIWVARRRPSVDGGDILVTSEILRVDVEPAPPVAAVPK